MLLIFGGAIVTGGFSLLSLAQHRHVLQADLRYPAIYVASTILLSLWMGKFAARADQLVFPIIALIAGVGILMITRLDAALGHRQLFWTVLGEAALALVLVFPRRVSTLRR